jgi:hypothetical protein
VSPAPSEPAEAGQRFVARSIYGAMTDRPLVELQHPTMPDAIRLTPKEARAIAYSILEAAEAAEFDAVMYRWAVRVMGMTVEQGAMLMRDFRTLRAQLAGEQDEPRQEHEPE